MPANRRWDAKRDQSEKPIVEALEAAGLKVWRDLPVDLLVRKDSDPPGILRSLEVKTLTATGKAPKRKDRAKQNEFIAQTGTPVVGTPEQAMEAVGC